MFNRWESRKERLLRFMKIPAGKKLEWLYEMQKFTNKFSSSKEQLRIRRKLRETR